MAVAQHYGDTKKKGAYKKYENLLDYRLWLMDSGLYPQAIVCYLKGVDMFQKTGMDVTKENLAIFRAKLESEGISHRRSREMVVGVENYERYKRGEPISTKLKLNKFSCDEDCFNCKYPDCMRPAYM